MRIILQDQFKLLTEGKLGKDVFIKQANELHPTLIKRSITIEEAVGILKNRNIISENFIGHQPINQSGVKPKESYEVAYAKFLKEAKEEKQAKAEEKTTTKAVEDKAINGYDFKVKDINNLSNQQFLTGLYVEKGDPKNSEKTHDQLIDMVVKNLSKDSLYYVKNSAFGLKGIGYSDELPGLKASKSDKMEKVKTDNDITVAKANTKDKLDAKIKSKVKDIMSMVPKTSKGVAKMDVPGKEKKIKLSEIKYNNPRDKDYEGAHIKGRFGTAIIDKSLGNGNYEAIVDDSNEKININKDEFEVLSKRLEDELFENPESNIPNTKEDPDDDKEYQRIKSEVMNDLGYSDEDMDQEGPEDEVMRETDARFEEEFGREPVFFSGLSEISFNSLMNENQEISEEELLGYFESEYERASGDKGLQAQIVDEWKEKYPWAATSIDDYVNNKFEDPSTYRTETSLDENKSEQSIPDGTKVIFDLNGIPAEDFVGYDEDEDEIRIISNYDGERAIATLGVDIPSGHGGDKDYEYYDLVFDDGYEMYAVSGFHLEPIDEEATDEDLYENETKRERKSRDGGYNAYIDGKSLKDNPHDEFYEKSEYTSWNKGWEQAKVEEATDTLKEEDLNEDAADDQEAFDAGYDAFEQGEPIDSNPHNARHREYEIWNEGWEDAQYNNFTFTQDNIKETNITKETMNESKDPYKSFKSFLSNKTTDKPVLTEAKIPVSKRLSEIEKMGVNVALETKINAIDEEIQSRTNRLKMVDENADLSELVDKNQMKALRNEIKLLEKQKDKYSKLYEKVTGKKKAEVIDEVEVEDEPIEEASEGDVKSQQELTTAIQDTKTAAEELDKVSQASGLSEETQPTEDELTKMKDELESYVDMVGNYEEAVEMYISLHPEEAKFKTTLQQLAEPMF